MILGINAHTLRVRTQPQEAQLDSTKRNTLKAIGAAAIGVSSTGALAALGKPQTAHFSVNTSHSALNNDIEVVLTNTASRDVIVDELAPGVLETGRGYFDFTAVTREGPVRVKAGESLRIGLQGKAFDRPSVDTAVMVKSSVRDSLREHLSIKSVGIFETVVSVESGAWLYA